jgi:hypothetical protein
MDNLTRLILRKARVMDNLTRLILRKARVMDNHSNLLHMLQVVMINKRQGKLEDHLNRRSLILRKA